MKVIKQQQQQIVCMLLNRHHYQNPTISTLTEKTFASISLVGSHLSRINKSLKIKSIIVVLLSIPVINLKCNYTYTTTTTTTTTSNRMERNQPIKSAFSVGFSTNFIMLPTKIK